MINAKTAFYFLFAAFALQLTACQNDGCSQSHLDEANKLTAQVTALEYSVDLQTIKLNESTPVSGISGEDIPEVFKNIPLGNGQYIYLNFDSQNQPRSLSYVTFVDELKVQCDGKVEYTEFGTKYEVTLQHLLNEGRWRAQHLSLCGTLEVPAGRKLIIYAKTSQLQDLTLITHENSFLGLLMAHTTYTGTTPQIQNAENSVLKLRFY